MTRFLNPEREEEASLRDAAFNTGLGVLAILPAYVGTLPKGDIGGLCLALLALSGFLWVIFWGPVTASRTIDWWRTRDYRATGRQA